MKRRRERGRGVERSKGGRKEELRPNRRNQRMKRRKGGREGGQEQARVREGRRSIPGGHR